MYLLPINVPIYVAGDRKFLATTWHRALLLLRDSFDGRFGDIAVVAPTLPVEEGLSSEALTEIDDSHSGLKLYSGFDLRCRAREYWCKQRSGWQRQVRELASKAQVVHAGMDDVFRPIAFEGFRQGVILNKPTVFVQDTDIVVQQLQLLGENPEWKRSVKAGVYSFLYERCCRWGVAHASLSLLKGQGLMNRYAEYALNPKEFHDTSFFLADIISREALEDRVRVMQNSKSLRLVYCGRLVARKGIDRSLRILALSVASGADINFDIIGDGEERYALEKLTMDLGLTNRVRFLGAASYDTALLANLATYDAMFFTPVAEDTPRMIFDGYAAGLPLIASDIPYVQERYEQEKATCLLPLNDSKKSAEALENLFKNREVLASTARLAREAAEYHSSENWYRRRAEWTIEAVQRHS